MWNFPLFPPQASTIATRVDAIFFLGLAITLFFTFAVCFTIIGFTLRYRRGTRVDRSHPFVSSMKMEALWIGGPLVIGLALFIPAAIVYFEIYNAPGDAFPVYVVGKQWMWNLQHPEGKQEINELHIPLGRAVKLIMTSEDVIHSFYVPAFRVKQDVLPGRDTEIWFRPTQVGKFHLFCAEYCGTDHSAMGGWVVVMEPSEYEAWLAGGNVNASMAQAGEKLFIQHHCSGCHGINSEFHAPKLAGVYGTQVPIKDSSGDGFHFVTADDRYIRDSILLPKSQIVAGFEPIMPSYQGQISEPDLYKIIAYIKSIGSPPQGGNPQ